MSDMRRVIWRVIEKWHCRRHLADDTWAIQVLANSGSVQNRWKDLKLNQQPISKLSKLSNYWNVQVPNALRWWKLSKAFEDLKFKALNPLSSMRNAHVSYLRLPPFCSIGNEPSLQWIKLCSTHFIWRLLQRNQKDLQKKLSFKGYALNKRRLSKSTRLGLTKAAA